MRLNCVFDNWFDLFVIWLLPICNWFDLFGIIDLFEFCFDLYLIDLIYLLKLNFVFGRIEFGIIWIDIAENIIDSRLLLVNLLIGFELVERTYLPIDIHLFVLNWFDCILKLFRINWIYLYCKFIWFVNCNLQLLIFDIYWFVFDKLADGLVQLAVVVRSDWSILGYRVIPSGTVPVRPVGAPSGSRSGQAPGQASGQVDWLQACQLQLCPYLIADICNGIHLIELFCILILLILPYYWISIWIWIWIDINEFINWYLNLFD